jgi:hypothetical protein
MKVTLRDTSRLPAAGATLFIPLPDPVKETVPPKSRRHIQPAVHKAYLPVVPHSANIIETM